MKKVYYQLKMYQKSPLRVSSGDNEFTDNDLMLDGRGCPFIPGSSVAGVLRELCRTRIPSLSDKDIRTLFGYIEDGKISGSHVLISDAVGPKEASCADYFITVRDGIRLDEWGITIPEHKYDFQTVETKMPYYSVLEWTGDEDSYQEEIVKGLELLMKVIASDGISFGARTTRGYGNMLATVKKKTFEFPAKREEWLKFDALDEESFVDADHVEGEVLQDDFIKIHADIEIEGSFSVRVSTARAESLPDGSIPDSIPLYTSQTAGDSERHPVIPGTSWAGVFRHHMQALLRQTGILEKKGQYAAELNKIFGIGEKKGEYTRSAICFGESVIRDGSPYSLTRNAVDRFTQAPRNKALFTDQFWQGGNGELNITIEKKKINKLQAQLLAISLIDLDMGLLSFGAGAETGHGRCRLTSMKVNGTDKIQRVRGRDSHFLEEAL